MDAIYFKIVLLIIFVIAAFGALAPALISAADDILFAAGVIVCITYVPICKSIVTYIIGDTKKMRKQK